MKPVNPGALPRHFLNKRSRDALIAYSKESFEHGHDDARYNALMKMLTTYNHEAFHTKLTLVSRKFYHCPNSAIPFHTCIVAKKRI